MSATFKVKDHVFWNSPQGETSGHVTKVITERTELNGHVVNASPAEPQYEVESEKTSKRAVHKGSALSRKKG